MANTKQKFIVIEYSLTTIVLFILVLSFAPHQTDSIHMILSINS
jgi:hypothetical protein